MASRLTQEPRETVLNPTDSKARLTQEPREVVLKPSDSKARLTQIAREVLVKRITPSAADEIFEYRVPTGTVDLDKTEQELGQSQALVPPTRVPVANDEIYEYRLDQRDIKLDGFDLDCAIPPPPSAPPVASDPEDIQPLCEPAVHLDMEGAGQDTAIGFRRKKPIIFVIT